MNNVSRYTSEHWEIAVVALLSVLLTGLMCVDLRAQIRKDEVDFEVLATVTMEKGDTLWELAEKYYDDPIQWRFVMDMNRIPDERRIPIGTVIYIPARDAKKPVRKVEVEEEKVKVERAAEEKLSAEMARLQGELNDLRGKNRELEAQNQRLTRSLKKCEDKSGQHAQEMKAKDARIGELKAELQGMRAAIKDKDARIEELEAELLEMRVAASEPLKARDKRIQELESQLSRSNRQLEELEKAYKELNDKLRRTEAAQKSPDQKSPAQRKPRAPVKKKSVDAKSGFAVIAMLVAGFIMWVVGD